jgi:biopolymer transport protein ExbD
MRFRDKFRQDLPGFQIAPMVDVIFNLLCFFLVGQIFSTWETELDVKVPTAQTGQVSDRLPGEIIINIKADGTVIVNRRTLDEAGLRALLGKIVIMYPGQPVTIRADKGTAYGHVIKVLDMCRQSDIWNIAFATTSSGET